MADSDDEDDQGFVVNFVDDSVVPNTDAIAFFNFEYCATFRSGVFGESAHC